MAGDLFALAARVQRLEKELPRKVSRMTGRMVGFMLADLIRVTPVDVSTAESNWQIAIGGEVVSRLPAYVPGMKGSTRAASAALAIAEGEKKLMQGRNLGQPIRIVNTVEYIHDLDTGSSKQFQFPGGFARRAEIIARSFLEDARL